MIEALLTGHSRVADYGQKLVSDLSNEQAVQQPAANVNHPAWILSHLNLYLPIMQSLMKGEEFPDPKDHTFGMQSKPEPDAGKYDDIKSLAREFREGNEAAAHLLREMGEPALHVPVKLERWVSGMPLSGNVLGYLMLAHQSIHLGQLSAWRRVLGLPPV